MGSAGYWEKRWQEKWTDRYDRSWPDRNARRLELKFIKERLTRLLRPIRTHLVEIGCGPFTLGEDEELYKLCRDRFIYHGIDACDAAIQEARGLYPELKFTCLDLTYRPAMAPLVESPTSTDLPCPEWLGIAQPGKGDPWIVLSRRTLQNLTPEERFFVLKDVLQATHGVLVEAVKSGLARLNSLRGALILPVMTEPEFNYYLETYEERAIRKVAYTYGFMEPYYALTRGVVQPDGFGGKIHDLAEALTVECQMDESVITAVCSPLKGFAW